MFTMVKEQSGSTEQSAIRQQTSPVSSRMDGESQVLDILGDFPAPKRNNIIDTGDYPALSKYEVQSSQTAAPAAATRRSVRKPNSFFKKQEEAAGGLLKLPEAGVATIATACEVMAREEVAAASAPKRKRSQRNRRESCTELPHFYGSEWPINLPALRRSIVPDPTGLPMLQTDLDEIFP